MLMSQAAANLSRTNLEEDEPGEPATAGVSPETEGSAVTEVPSSTGADADFVPDFSPPPVSYESLDDQQVPTDPAPDFDTTVSGLSTDGQTSGGFEVHTQAPRPSLEEFLRTSPPPSDAPAPARSNAMLVRIPTKEEAAGDEHLAALKADLQITLGASGVSPHERASHNQNLIKLVRGHLDLARRAVLFYR